LRVGEISAEIADGLSPWAEGIKRGKHQLTLTARNEEALPEINRYLVTHGVSVYEISPKHISLEELFIETVGKEGGL
jgi:hypothetical protein